MSGPTFNQARQGPIPENCQNPSYYEVVLENLCPNIKYSKAHHEPETYNPSPTIEARKLELVPALRK